VCFFYNESCFTLNDKSHLLPIIINFLNSSEKKNNFSLLLFPNLRYVFSFLRNVYKDFFSSEETYGLSTLLFIQVSSSYFFIFLMFLSLSLFIVCHIHFVSFRNRPLAGFDTNFDFILFLYNLILITLVYYALSLLLISLLYSLSL